MNYLYTTLSLVTASIASPILFIIALLWYRTTTVPSSIPWTGLKNKTFLPKIRACLREFTALRAPLEEGYEAYTKNDKPFIAPAFHWPDVILPPSNFSWLLAQPEDVLSVVKVQDDVLGLSYLSHGPDLASRTDFTVVRQDLTRNLQRIIPSVLDEIEHALSTTELNDLPLPSPSEEEEEAEWTPIPIFSILWTVSRRLSHRIFVGLPLCRDKKYIQGLQRWELAFGICSAVMRYLIPSFLKPWFAPIVALPARILGWRLKRLVLPVMRARIASQTKREARDEKSEGGKGEEKPNDILQWLMDDKHASSRPANSRSLTLDEIAGKTIELNFFSVATIALNTSSILADILSHPDPSLITLLRHEATTHLPHLPTTPLALRSMANLDSTIRESLRLHTMGARGLTREVIPASGVTTPDGFFLARGTHVSMLISSRQRDGEVWERGGESVPLRFVKGREGEGGEGECKGGGGAKNAVHVSEDFLSFGYGRHACPGRFFAVQAMKVLIGYLLVHYDFEPLEQRPKFTEIGEAIVADESIKVRVRRRRQEDDLLI